MESILLFANPIAGRGRGRVIASRVWEAFTRAGYAVHGFLDPAGQIDPERLRAASPLRAAICIGGDGTLRAVTARLLEVFPPSDIPPLLLVPLGTANLMRRHLALPWKGQGAAERMIAAVQAHKIARLDAARANGELFLLVAGVGMDGHVVHELARVRTGPINLASYVLPTAMALQRYDYPPIRVEVDGATVFGPAPGMAFVGNVAEYGTGFPILSHARSDDGLLDICVLPCASRADAIQLMLRAVASEHFLVEGALYLNGRHIRVNADRPVPIQVDGDPAGHTPLEVQLLPVQVPFIVE